MPISNFLENISLIFAIKGNLKIPKTLAIFGKKSFYLVMPSGGFAARTPLHSENGLLARLLGCRLANFERKLKGNEENLGAYLRKFSLLIPGENRYEHLVIKIA